MNIIDLTALPAYHIGLALLEANGLDPRAILRTHAIADEHNVVTFERVVGFTGDGPVVEHVDLSLPPGHPWRFSG